MPEFDPAKDAINLAKHGVSLARWGDLQVRSIVRDDRFDYGEPRFRTYGHLDGEAHCLVFTMRDHTTPHDRSACGAPMPRR
jgi:hypothetical protein